MKLKYLLLLFMFFIFSFPFAFAVTNNCNTNVGITNVGIDLLSDPTGRSCPNLGDSSSSNGLADSLGKKVNVIVKVILGFSATIGLIAFVYAGVIILTSKGDPKSFQSGVNVIKYTFIGIIIIIFSYAIVSFLTNTIPNITGAGGSSGSAGNTIENGYWCAGSTEAASLGKCYYLLKTYIDSNSTDFNVGYPSDWNKDSSVCGRSVGFCAVENGIEYCLRCVDKTKIVPSNKIYSPQYSSNKKPI